MIPNRYRSVVALLITSLIMSCIVSGVSVAKSTGLAPGFVPAWLSAWGTSWMIAFPVLLVVLPLVQRLVSARFEPHERRTAGASLGDAETARTRAPPSLEAAGTAVDFERPYPTRH